jgi:glycine cleavage system regulatory protein
MMKTRVILSASGSDRPGLTRSLAEAVLAAGGNWLESHLSRLGGRYVGAVLVELDADKLAGFADAIRSVDASGLAVSLVAAGDEPVPAGEMLQLELVGQDRPGIVREVTSVLADLGVNIEDFDTGTQNGAWSGERLFRAAARLNIPPGTTSDQVRSALEAISGEIMVDFSFSAKR